jgi:hypothetical protein
MLTGYATPDPLPTFTAPRSLAVFGMDTRADLARIFRASFGQLGVDKGDEGGGGGTAMRADFKATAWFQPAVKTGADGRTHVRFKLPDNLTTFRVMAVAVAKDDRFGDGDAQVTTSRPLMLRPALPRFLRAGDAIDAGVVVSTKGMGDAQIEVTAAGDGVTVGGDAKRVVAVKKGESVEVRWPITAPRAGQAKLTFRARAGGESDAVEVQKRVDAPATMETVALEGETKSVSWGTSGLSATTWAGSTCGSRRRRWWGSATGWSSSSSTLTDAPSSSRAASCRSSPRGTWRRPSASRCRRIRTRWRTWPSRRSWRTSGRTAASAGGRTRASRTRG